MKEVYSYRHHYWQLSKVIICCCCDHLTSFFLRRENYKKSKRLGNLWSCYKIMEFCQMLRAFVNKKRRNHSRKQGKEHNDNKINSELLKRLPFLLFVKFLHILSKKEKNKSYKSLLQSTHCTRLFQFFRQIPDASLHDSIIQPRHILSGGDTAMWCDRIWSWKYYCIVECCGLVSQKSL